MVGVVNEAIRALAALVRTGQHRLTPDERAAIAELNAAAARFDRLGPPEPEPQTKELA